MKNKGAFLMKEEKKHVSCTVVLYFGERDIQIAFLVAHLSTIQKGVSVGPLVRRKDGIASF